MKKLDGLSLLAHDPELDVSDVAERLSSSVAASGMLLLRLFRQGLLKRELDPDDGLHFYSLTPKGRARLGFFQRQSRRPKRGG